MVKIGINGFGRIGRPALRIALNKPGIDIVAINSRAAIGSHAHLFKYDSNYGTFGGNVVIDGDMMVINGKHIKIFREEDPSKIPWGDADIDVVIESTGVFRKRADAAKHLNNGVKRVNGVERVIVTAPGKDDFDATIVMGVNEQIYDPNKHFVISNASCTTNCLAPVCKVLNDEFEIERGFMTTVHAYTVSQKLIDKSHKDFRRARAAAMSIIPTTTGAARSVGLVIPELQGKLNAIALRVPTSTVSVVDFTCVLKRGVTKEGVNAAFAKASNGKLKGILAVSNEPLVSIDYKASPYSAVIDTLSTDVTANNMVKILAWYDNEWGYACRILDLIEYMMSIEKKEKK